MKYNKKLTISAILGAFVLGGLGAAATSDAKAQPAERQERFIERFFERADANKDGVIDRSEAKLARERVFNRMDADNDGIISRKEHEDFVMKRVQRMIERRFNRRDTNRDGTISLKEFAEGPTPRFDRADANKDGYVTLEEMKALREKRRAWRQGK